MQWDFEEAITHYKTLGAPKDQSALIGLLRELQQENGGRIPGYMLQQVAQAYDVKESFLLAIVKRIPSLRLESTHCLELCAGPYCRKHTALAAYAEELHKASGKKFTLKFVPCMRMCGKGPNIKWDGTLHHGVDEALLKTLLKDAKMDF